MKIESEWPEMKQIYSSSLGKSFLFDWFGTQRTEFFSKRDEECFPTHVL